MHKWFPLPTHRRSLLPKCRERKMPTHGRSLLPKRREKDANAWEVSAAKAQRERCQRMGGLCITRRDQKSKHADAQVIRYQECNAELKSLPEHFQGYQQNNAEVWFPSLKGRVLSLHARRVYRCMQGKFPFNIIIIDTIYHYAYKSW